jgi:hypothetical protein
MGIYNHLKVLALLAIMVIVSNSFNLHFVICWSRLWRPVRGEISKVILPKGCQKYVIIHQEIGIVINQIILVEVVVRRKILMKTFDLRFVYPIVYVLLAHFTS